MKNYILPVILASLLLLSGASGCPQKSSTQVQAAGLLVEFSKDAPPLSVSVNQEFPVYINVYNQGGDYVSKGDAKFYLTGIGPNLENLKPSVVNDATLSKESISPDRISLAEKAKFTFPLQNLLILPLVMTSCYNYGTTSQSTVCIAGNNESSICSVSGVKETSNSISPILVSGITEEVIGNKLRLSFNLENKLGGQVYLPETDCDGLLRAKDFNEAAKMNMVNIEIRTNEPGLLCKLQSKTAPYSSADALVGVSEIGKVTCEKTISSNEDHVAPVYVILKYKYVSSITKNLNVLP